MTISLVPKTAFGAAVNLLATAHLPVDDISDRTELFELTSGDEVLGTIGLEYEGRVGLLRSLSVAEAFRGKGYGDQLVQFLEKAAKEKGVETLYLFTTTAASFFAKRGYNIIKRTEVPPFIRQSSEFASVCPASATVMKKELQNL